MMGWPMVTLEAAAEIRGGGTPRREDPTYWDGGIPWLTPSDLPPVGAGITSIRETADSITEEGLASSAATLLPPGTVLFSSRASIGKVGIAAVPVTTNQGFANLIPRRGIEPRYLAWCVSHHAQQIASLAGSTTFREVTKSALRRFRIPLPPPSEQRRIVDILDHADHLRHLRAEADTKADRILPALFLKMFGDPNRPTLPMAPLPDFVDFLDHKRIPVRESDRAGRTGEIPYYGANGLVGYIDEPIFDETLVLLAEDGGYWGPAEQSAYKIQGPSWVNNHAHVLRCKEGFDPDYIVWSLNLLDLRRFVSGTTRGKLTQAGMNVVDLPLADPSLQSTFGKYARFLMRLEIDRCRVERRLRSGFANLLHSAFTGSLTSGWRKAHSQELPLEMQQRASVSVEG